MAGSKQTLEQKLTSIKDLENDIFGKEKDIESIIHKATNVLQSTSPGGQAIIQKDVTDLKVSTL